MGARVPCGPLDPPLPALVHVHWVHNVACFPEVVLRMRHLWNQSPFGYDLPRGTGLHDLGSDWCFLARCVTEVKGRNVVWFVRCNVPCWFRHRVFTAFSEVILVTMYYYGGLWMKRNLLRTQGFIFNIDTLHLLWSLGRAKLEFFSRFLGGPRKNLTCRIMGKVQKILLSVMWGGQIISSGFYNGGLWENRFGSINK